MKFSVDELKSVLKPGDIILFHSNSCLNWAIRTITQSYWGHVAMFIGDDLFVESAAEGVHILDIAVLTVYDIEILRYKPKLQKSTIKSIIEYCKKSTGSPYDYIAIVQLLFYLLKGRRDRLEDIGEKRKYICSEILAEAYMTYGCDILPGRKSSEIIPADYDISPNFTRVEI